MKIVSCEEFARMPAGTIFAPYEPYVLKDRMEIKVDQGQMVKGWHVQPYWAYNGTMPLEPWNLEDMEGIGARAPAEYCIYDGDNNDMLDEEMVLVLEPEDVELLIRTLKWAQQGCKGEQPGVEERDGQSN